MAAKPLQASTTARSTRLDQVVIPNLDAANGSSSLRPASASVVNLATQDICPGNTAEHLALGSYDPVGWALALDALKNRGPMSAARIPLTVCAQTLMPGVDEASFAQRFAALGNAIATNVRDYPRSAAEPPLKCYANNAC